jgi:hypothetical protein
LSTTGKLFEKVILKIVQRHTEERSLLNASQFGFLAHHSMTLQCMRLMDQATLNFNNNVSMNVVFLDIEKAFDTTWHLGLLYKLSELQFSNSLIKPMSSFLSQRKFRLLVKGEMSTPRDTQTGVQYHSLLSLRLYSTYINDTNQTPGVCIGLFADDTCIDATDRNKGYIFQESCSEVSVLLRRGVSAGT